jgi:CRISPR-associated protein Cas2
MYVIAIYDVGEKRVGKMLKLCRRYLNWIQNSVFEGELTEVQILSLEIEAKNIMQEDSDSFIIFKSRDIKWLEKKIIGLEKNNLDNFL